APHAPLPAPARRLTLSESFAGSRALALGYAAPALAHVDHAALVLASYILLGSNNSSRDELRAGLTVREFAAGLSDAGEHGLFWVYARVDKQRLEDARTALLSRVRLLTTQPPSRAALERAKRAALLDWLSHFVSLERRAALLGRYE